MNYIVWVIVIVVMYYYQCGWSLSLRRSSASLTPKVSSSTLAIPVTSTSNAQIKLLRSLREKKKRYESGLVLLEGHRAIRDAVASGVKLVTVASTEYARSHSLYKDFKALMRSPSQFTELLVSDEVFSSLSDTMHGQGIVASAVRPTPISLLKDSQLPVVLLLDRMMDPGNVGTLVRTGFGMGVQGVIAVETCDVWSPKVVRASMGTILQLPIFEASWSTVPSLVKNLFRDRLDPVNIIVADGNHNNQLYTTVDYTKAATLLIIGSEAVGISPSARELPSHISSVANNVRIPTARPLESFNAASAGAIILAEILRQRQGEA